MASQTGSKRRKARSRGTCKQVEMALFSTLKELECRVIQNLEIEELCRLSHALATVSGSWLKANEYGLALKQIEKLEEMLNNDS